MTTLSAREIGDRGLQIVVGALKPFVEESFRRADGDDWARRAGVQDAQGGAGYYHLDDIYGLLSHLQDRTTWQRVFRSRVREDGGDDSGRYLARELDQLRDRQVHNRSFDARSAWQVIDTSRRLIRSLGVSDRDALVALDGLEVQAASLLAQGRDDLGTLRKAYFENRVGPETAHLDLGGISPSLGGSILRVRLRSVYTEPSFDLLAASRPELSTSQEVRGEGDAAISDLGEGTSLPTLAALAKRGVVILGPPGAGKTTLLRHIARTSTTDVGPFGARTPVLVSGARLAEAISGEPGLGLRRYLTTRFSDTYGDLFVSELELGRLLVLIDGLDEIPGESRRRPVVTAIDAFARDHPEVIVVATSRPTGYVPGSLGPLFVEARIRPLGRHQRRTFVEQWLALLELPDERDNAEEVTHLLERSPGVIELASNPLLLTIIVLLWARGSRLPERRIELYQVATETLLRDWPSKRLGVSTDAALLYGLLEPIAHHLIGAGVNTIGERELTRRFAGALGESEGLEPAAARKRAKDLLALIETQTGFFVEQGRAAGERAFGFIHRTFAEYLAAKHLAQQWSAGTLSLTDYLHRSHWAETVLLFFGHLGTWGPEPVSQAVRALLALDWPAERHLAKNLRLALVLLAREAVTLRADLRDELMLRAIRAFCEGSKDLFAHEFADAVGHVSTSRAHGDPARWFRSVTTAEPSRMALLQFVAAPDSDQALRRALAVGPSLGDVNRVADFRNRRACVPTHKHIFDGAFGVFDEWDRRWDWSAELLWGRNWRTLVHPASHNRLRALGVATITPADLASDLGLLDARPIVLDTSAGHAFIAADWLIDAHDPHVGLVLGEYSDRDGHRTVSIHDVPPLNPPPESIAFLAHHLADPCHDCLLLMDIRVLLSQASNHPQLAELLEPALLGLVRRLGMDGWDVVDVDDEDEDEDSEEEAETAGWLLNWVRNQPVSTRRTLLGFMATAGWDGTYSDAQVRPVLAQIAVALRETDPEESIRRVAKLVRPMPRWGLTGDAATVLLLRDLVARHDWSELEHVIRIAPAPPPVGDESSWGQPSESWPCPPEIGRLVTGLTAEDGNAGDWGVFLLGHMPGLPGTRDALLHAARRPSSRTRSLAVHALTTIELLDPEFMSNFAVAVLQHGGSPVRALGERVAHSSPPELAIELAELGALALDEAFDLDTLRFVDALIVPAANAGFDGWCDNVPPGALVPPPVLY